MRITGPGVVFTLRPQSKTSNIFLEKIYGNVQGVADWSFLTNHARVLLRITHDPVPLEYSIAWLICSVTCGLEPAMVGWPGVAQDRLLAGSPGTWLCCRGCFPQGPGQGR
ncbi:MAG TPA: hypothetical protein VFW50_09165 [Streptosporangiaceae bacterium]|nr:hypothetical protein [Streptosporangiaceae bacterium]